MNIPFSCPKCHHLLEKDENHQRYICNYDKIAFAIEDGIVNFLLKDAKPIED